MQAVTLQGHYDALTRGELIAISSAGQLAPCCVDNLLIPRNPQPHGCRRSNKEFFEWTGVVVEICSVAIHELLIQEVFNALADGVTSATIRDAVVFLQVVRT